MASVWKTRKVGQADRADRELLRSDPDQYRQRQVRWNEANKKLRDAIGRGQITARGVPASDRERLHQSLPREIAVLAIQFRNDVIEPDGTATDAEVAAIRASAHFVRVRFDTAEIRALCPQKFADQGVPARGNPQPFPDAEHIAPWVAVSWRAFGTLEAPSHIVGHRSFDHGDSRLPDEEQASYESRQTEHLVFDAAEREVMNLLARGHIKAVGQLPARAASGKRLHVPGPAHTEIPPSTFLNQQLAFNPDGELIQRLATLDRLFPSLNVRGSDADPGFALYHDVLIESAELREAWQADTENAANLLSINYSTGTAGRPSSKHLALIEMRRRAAAGELASGIGKESKALSDWLKREHPRAPPCTPKGLENSLRDDFRALRQSPK